MKKLFSQLILFLLLLSLLLQTPAWAEEEELSGAKIFSSYCASCHINGNNVLIASKTLKKEALLQYLKRYEEDPEAAIINQVTNGKNAMPAFKNRLTPEEIKRVANYVVQQAEQGW